MTKKDYKKSVLLSSDSSDEKIDRLIDEIFELREKIEKLEKEKKPAKALRYPIKKKRKRWKKLGRSVGHSGSTRKKPDKIDHTEHQTLEVCPDCGCKKLTELPSEAREHVQEDLIPVKVSATKYIRHGYWCPCCKEKKEAPYAAEEIPYGYLGPNILIQAVLMKYHYGLSYDKMVGMFGTFSSLKVTGSALAQALQRISRWLNVEQEVILEAIRKSPYLHIDETGWKIAGTNHWLWCFVNERLALYRIRRSRGRKIPEEILTDDYSGIVISDFLSAYDKSGKRRQRCLTHLARDMEKYRQINNTEESLKAYKKLRRIIKDAYRLDERRKELELWVFYRRVERIKKRLWDFACRSFRDNNWNRISKRLLKYYDEILTFLEVPGLAKDNNHAERMIKPNVIFRKISFQNMSGKGAEAHEVLMTILQTLRLQNEDVKTFFTSAYLKHRQGNKTPILTAE